MLEWNYLWYQYSFPSCSHDWGDADETAKASFVQLQTADGWWNEPCAGWKKHSECGRPISPRRWLSLDFTDATLLSQPCWALCIVLLRWLSGFWSAPQHPKSSLAADVLLWVILVQHWRALVIVLMCLCVLHMRLTCWKCTWKARSLRQPRVQVLFPNLNLNLSTRRNATRTARQTPLVRIARAWRCLCY